MRESMNEEELKIQVVLTALEKFGIRREEVSCAKSFSFRAGREITLPDELRYEAQKVLLVFIAEKPFLMLRLNEPLF
jgi:hypothetical protein